MSKLIPPYVRCGGANRSQIDWNSLRYMFLHQKLEAREFLSQFKNIDLSIKRVQSRMRDWTDEKLKARARNHQIRRLKDSSLADNDLATDETVIDKLNTVKLRQGISDHEAAQKVKEALVLRSQIENLPTNELAMISKSLDILQNIQRTALGLKENEIGTELLLPQADKETNTNTPDNVPTFLVEMNDNGKFTRSKPRQLQ